jgi:hypothetical protein
MQYLEIKTHHKKFSIKKVYFLFENFSSFSTKQFLFFEETAKIFYLRIYEVGSSCRFQKP